MIIFKLFYNCGENGLVVRNMNAKTIEGVNPSLCFGEVAEWLKAM